MKEVKSDKRSVHFVSANQLTPTVVHQLLLILGFLGVLHTAYGQSRNWTKVQERSLVALRYSLQERPELPTSSRLLISPLLTTNQRLPDRPANLAAAPIPAAWDYQELAFFCKLEVKMEKALKLPLKFRLGEVQAVEKMEGKLKTHFSSRE